MKKGKGIAAVSSRRGILTTHTRSTHRQWVRKYFDLLRAISRDKWDQVSEVIKVPPNEDGIKSHLKLSMGNFTSLKAIIL